MKTLKDTIEKVRKGEEIDIRAALGTGDPEIEKAWEDGKPLIPLFMIPLFFVCVLTNGLVLKGIEEEQLNWKGKNQPHPDSEEEKSEQ